MLKHRVETPCRNTVANQHVSTTLSLLITLLAEIFEWILQLDAMESKCGYVVRTDAPWSAALSDGGLLGHQASGPFGTFGNTARSHSRHSCVSLLSIARVRRSHCYDCIFSPCSDNCGCEKSVAGLPEQPTGMLIFADCLLFVWLAAKDVLLPFLVFATMLAHGWQYSACCVTAHHSQGRFTLLFASLVLSSFCGIVRSVSSASETRLRYSL